MQVVGFTEKDSYTDVIDKGAKGLSRSSDNDAIDSLLLICSSGMVPNCPINGQSWALGEYIKQHGGTSNRSKKVWGICQANEEESDIEMDTPVCILN